MLPTISIWTNKAKSLRGCGFSDVDQPRFDFDARGLNLKCRSLLSYGLRVPCDGHAVTNEVKSFLMSFVLEIDMSDSAMLLVKLKSTP